MKIEIYDLEKNSRHLLNIIFGIDNYEFKVRFKNIQNDGQTY